MEFDKKNKHKGPNKPKSYRCIFFCKISKSNYTAIREPRVLRESDWLAALFLSSLITKSLFDYSAS